MTKLAKQEQLEALCEDCPPVGYPTDRTRCLPCPRRKDIDANGFEIVKKEKN